MLVDLFLDICVYWHLRLQFYVDAFKQFSFELVCIICLDLSIFVAILHVYVCIRKLKLYA